MDRKLAFLLQSNSLTSPHSLFHAVSSNARCSLGVKLSFPHQTSFFVFSKKGRLDSVANTQSTACP